MRSILTICVVALVSLAANAEAQEQAAKVAAGKKATQHQCSSCHDVSGKSPPSHPPGGAPAFLEVAQSSDWTAHKLRQFLRFPHGRMVNLLLTGSEADSAVAYILSLR